MAEETTTDVNQADETTASESSTTEETTTDAPADAGASDDQKTVPYDRFKEVNEGYQMTKSELQAMKQELEELKQSMVKQQTTTEDPQEQQAKETLKGFLKEVAPELGFVSKDELRQQEQDRELEGELKRLEKAWDGSKDPALKFSRKEVIDYALKNGIGSPEAAFKLMKEKELINYYIKTAGDNSRGIATEGSNGSGSSQAGTTDDDLKKAALDGDREAHLTYLKRFIPKNK